ncbi:MAG: 5-(carboxyamino)imidazole ribonucleotide synthase [Gammaproteobacteria bacterium]|nr:5-(carboxyamino)imidazole ribonucleotide synthase [Gammaproteobacteria bacterium]
MSNNMILPGATIGVLGGGQLGRMFVVAARTMGYKTVVLDPDKDSPAGLIADQHICSDYEDAAGLAQMAVLCDAVTTEFENVPADSLRALAKSCFVSPSAEAVEIAQNRGREKNYARQAGLETAPFKTILSADDIAAAAEITGFPAILKLSSLGYDGKGQAIVNSVDEITEKFKEFASVECVLEKMLDLKQEVSVILGRNSDGDVAVFPVAENVHVNGILHTSTVPANVSAEITEQARALAKALADSLNYVGILAVEFFITGDNRLVFNEMAPRPHNSGHYTLDATVTSQYEQQVRSLCGLPVGDARLTSAVVMVNLLGDLWPLDWTKLLAEKGLKLHLYGKEEARPGRKMGHYNVLAESVGQAKEIADNVFKIIS